MINPHDDLWPDNIAQIGNLVTPLSILKEQATYLTKKTKSLLKGSVVNWSDEYDRWAYNYAFFIEAPVLSNYRYHLFTIHHDTKLYPLVITEFTGDDFSEITSQDKLLEVLKIMFNHAETKSVIRSMLAQVRDYGADQKGENLQEDPIVEISEDDIPF